MGTKHARKKAARQRATAVASAEQGTTAQARSASTDTEHTAVTDRRGTPLAADCTQSAAAHVLQETAKSAHNSLGASRPLLQQPTVGTSHAAAQSDWWRCPLSGRVMRDPVLYGSGGHSFEREVLEQWLAANPGVDPLTLRALPLGGGNVLTNHALRNMIQQLQLS